MANLGGPSPSWPGETKPVAAGDPRAAVETLAKGSQVGRYLVFDLLGAGGMGVVYAAYDPQLDRRVAIKVLRPDRGGGAVEMAARLLAEAQALARLSHANVLPVYDVGTLDDQVYVVMEHVEGATLAGWLERPRPWREVLGVFVAAGRGLAAVHGAGLVHRDFKPANVLVGDGGLVKVVDFGLAQAADAPAEEVVRGTPAYMPPEQRRGERSTARGDQFSFAVALWEALYGPRPAAGAAPAAGKVVPAHVGRALARALAADPARRFATMDELLADLARDPARARLRIALVAGVGLAAAAAGMLAHAAAAGRGDLCAGAGRRLAGVWDAPRRADVERAFLATGRPYAPAAFASAAAALDGWSTSYRAMHRDACEATRVRGEQSAEMLDRRIACLERQRDEVGALVAVFAAADTKVVDKAPAAAQALGPVAACTAPPPVAPPRAADAAAVAALRQELDGAQALRLAGKLKDAAALAEKAQAEAERIGYAPARAEADYRLATARSRMGAPGATHELLGRAADTAEAAGADRLAALATLEALYVATQAARLDEAAAAARHAVALVTRIGGGDLGATLHLNLGTLAQTRGLYLAAEAETRILLAILGPEATVTRGNAENNLGNALEGEGRFADAEAAHERAVALKERTLGAGHPDVGWSQFNLSGDLMLQGRYADSLALLRRILPAQVAAFGAESHAVAAVRNSIGSALLRLGRLDEARPEFEAAVAIEEKVYGPDHPNVAMFLNGVADVLDLQGQHEPALERYRRALEILEKALGPDHPQTEPSHVGMGDALHALGRNREALAEYQKGVAVLEKAGGDANEKLYDALMGVARVEVALRAPAEALAPLRRAVALAPDPTARAEAQSALARATAARRLPFRATFRASTESRRR